MPKAMRDIVDNLGIQIVKTVRDLKDGRPMDDNDMMMFVGNGMQLLCIAINTLDRIADAVEALKPPSPIINPYDRN